MNSLKYYLKLHNLSKCLLSKPVKNISLVSQIKVNNYSSEVEKSKNAVRTKDDGTIFDKIISKEIQANIIYEDDLCLAFNDIMPQAPVHFLVIPKRRIKTLDSAVISDQNILGHLLLTARLLAKKELPNGYRVVINNGVDGCQSVYHLHVHVLGGRQLTWPPG